jgi:predicted DNA-binding transcriptional regulator AlpA
VERRFIGIKELGEYLGIKPQTIRNRLSSGTFPIRPFKICGRIRFDTKGVERYLIRLKSGREDEVDNQQGACDTTF